MDQPSQNQFEKLLTQAIQKNMAVFGPTIVFAKLKHIPTIIINNEGNVIKTQGKPHEIIQLFIAEFMQLSSFVTKKTMQPLIDFNAQKKQ